MSVAIQFRHTHYLWIFEWVRIVACVRVTTKTQYI